MNKTKCKICGKEIGNKGLTSHFKNTHSISSKEYYDKYLKQEGEGKCLECGKETKFIKFTKGYHTFCSTKCSNNNKGVSKLKKESYIRKYGVDNPAKAEPVKDKIKQTNLERYGVENVFQSPTVREKCVNTCIERYGVSNAAKTDMVQNKMKQTFLEKYGVKNPTQSPIVQEKVKKTYLEKYGVEHPWKLNEENNPLGLDIEFPKDKGLKTMRENKSIGSSKMEKELELKLRELFPDLRTQYKSELYPFKCDFYIPSLDLYIEYNGIWTHGGCFYDKNNEDNRNTLEMWKQRSEHSRFYQNAINTWTQGDILKLNTAIENNLNYVAWFNKEQAYDWINAYKKSRTN